MHVDIGKGSAFSSLEDVFDFSCLTAVSWSSDQDNLAISGCGWRVSLPSGDVDLSGIAGGTDGMIVLLFNASTNKVKIKHEDSGTAINSLLTVDENDFDLNAWGSVYIRYDGMLSRWHLLSAAKN